jgi:hypothetical protein
VSVGSTVDSGVVDSSAAVIVVLCTIVSSEDSGVEVCGYEPEPDCAAAGRWPPSDISDTTASRA